MAGLVLQKVKYRFVYKVSRHVLRRLVDLLLKDHVLNGEEEDIICEGRYSRADQARSLIDYVIRKGERASTRLIYHLQNIDPVLHSELGLSSDQPGLSVQLTPSVPTVEDFLKTIRTNPEVYPVTQTSLKNRVALLITNIKFSEESMNRWGAEKDEENMEKLLSYLGYEVVKYTNLTGKAIDEALIDFTKHPKLKYTDSVFVVLMSHGKLGKILGVDWKEDKPDEFPINNIFKHLGSKSCPELRDKPKVIIIQACRGGHSAGYVLQSENHAADMLHHLILEKDFIYLSSCIPDTVSYRQRDRGSLLIQSIVEAFSPERYQEDIYGLFEKIEMETQQYSFDQQMMSEMTRNTLTKHFYPLTGIRKMSVLVKEDKDTVTDAFSESEGCSYGTSTKVSSHEKEEQEEREEDEEDEQEEEDEESAHTFKFCCEKCKSITQTHGTKLVTPQRISNGRFQMQLEGEGSYECSVTGLVFEASEPVLVRYSVLSWSKFGSFLPNSWKFAGPIFDIDTVNKEASVLTSIHLPHSVCLGQSLDNAVSFKILHVVDEDFSEAVIEPPSGYSGSHVKWSVRSLSPVCPIIPADEQAEYHGMVMIYKQMTDDTNTNNNIFHVYLVLNNVSAIKDVCEQVQSYPNKYVRVTKSPMCRLVEGIFRLSSKPEGVVSPQELEFTLAEIAVIGFFEVFFDKQPPFEWSLRKRRTDEVVWSATIRADDWQAAIKENPRKRARCDDELRAKSHRGQDLSEKQLLQVANKFGSEWKEAAIYLDLLRKDLDDILEKEKDVTMQKHRMLVMWKNRRRQGEATASALLESLKDMDKLSTFNDGRR
ncbi:uncharacterized protein LOC116708286 isoform X2 [Xiphophorus hellerii]|uniref:uncharacterized protein LOC116708286 isoform X2 n=1 Tax=Xiphophorus hellerii TaxID=8084 RepID=UPI0013B3AAFF|nr:uncharacterized protein LOC116708286 isoform X2 [Xiphophorus hellerii]